MTGGSPNLGLNGNDKPKMESVPSLISATAATAEAPKLSFFPSFEVGENVAVPVLQSRPGFVPLPASSRHRESELIPVFSGVNTLWGSQVVGSPYQVHGLQYGNMCVPVAPWSNLKRKAESTGDLYNRPPMDAFFGHIPGGFGRDSVFHAGFMPIQAVFQNPFMPTAVRAPPLSYNLSAPLSIEVAKRPEMNVFSASQCPKIGNPSDISSSDSIHTQKMLRLSMDISSDRHEIVNLGASDKHELPLLWKNNAPSVTLSDIINSSETRPGSSPPANIHEDDEEIKGKGWLMLVQKELRNTDVGNLGRIVLPKKDAEANLPPLVAKDGLVLQMEDMKYSVNWKFKYRYWPNNRSRMYVMENTGNFVKMHDLQPGDLFVVYKDESSGKYIVRGKKAVKPAHAEDKDGSIHRHRVGEADRDWYRQIWPEQGTSIQLGTL